MVNTLWGATPEEWAVWRSLHPEHLLPTVCNPEAAVSKKSQLYRIDKTTGQLLHPAKVPSLYNRKKQIAGIRQWASLPITPAMLDIWQQEPDYGICMRTGNGVIAVDCDSENEEIQALIQELTLELFGVIPQRRYRSNSNKCLYLLAVEGEYRKRIHRLDGDNGIIEMLADGNQAVVAGTHPSGARILWDNDLPDEPVVITPEQLESLWSMLAERLPVVNSTEAGASRLRDRSQTTPNATDETADFLDANGWTLNFGASGERYIRCPFEDGHSGATSHTSTVYFPGGTAGFEWLCWQRLLVGVRYTAYTTV